MSKKISVVMAVYNGGRFLREQLNSIVEQSLAIDELIIIDDCSSERCDEIIMDCMKGREIDLKYIIHTDNKGYAQTFFEAIRSATGNLIFLSDQDDIWEKRKVQICTKIMYEHPEISCLSSLNILIDQIGNEIKREKRPKTYLSKVTSEELIKQKKLRPGMSLAIRRDLADRMKELNTEEYRQHDRLIEYISVVDEGFYILGDYLNKYRIHDNNTSGLNLSHYRLRSDINGRIAQIDKEVRYLELIKPIDINNKQIIEQCVENNNLRKRLLTDGRILQYIIYIPMLFHNSYCYRILAGDILCIITNKINEVHRR